MLTFLKVTSGAQPSWGERRGHDCVGGVSIVLAIVSLGEHDASPKTGESPMLTPSTLP